MAKKLSIEIKLEGAREIKRELAEMGEEGKKAFGEINKAARQAGGFDKLGPEKIAQFTAELKKAGAVGPAALNQISSAVDKAARTEKLVAGVKAVESAFSTLTSAAKLAGAAFGPVGLAIALVGTKIVGAMSDAAKSIGEVEKAAIKLGVSIETVNALRKGFERAGLSADQVKAAVEGVGSAVEAGKLERVTTALKQLQEATARGYGVGGTDQLKLLVETAQGVGPAADAARKGLADLGVTVSSSGTSLQDFITKTGNIATGTQLFVQSLRAMKDQTLAAQIAVQTFGEDAGIALLAPVTPVRTLSQEWNKLTAELGKFMTTAIESPPVLNTLKEISTIIGAINTLLSATPEQWGQAISDSVDMVVRGLGFLIDKAKEAFGWLAKMFTAGAVAGGEALQGHAAGGRIGGRGTGTSDSNLAWVSRGEYIVPARAVRQPGVLPVLEALRRSGNIPGFARGGSVGMGLGGLGVTASDLLDPVVRKFESLSSAIAEGFRQTAKQDTLTEGIKDIKAAIGSLARSSMDMMQGITSLSGKIEAALSHVRDSTKDSAGTIQKSMSELADKVAANNPPASGREIRGREILGRTLFASGGLLGGRGTGTSDSNLAWLSRGEYVVPARAVRQPGMLAFLEALRRSGGNLSRVLDRMGHFATGGMVGLPAFAAGGGVGGMSHVTIAFPGLPEIGGLRASSAVVEQLQRAAAMAQVRSGGRKPSRYG